jgi:UDP-N-acetylglucosamine 2-epimerase
MKWSIEAGRPTTFTDDTNIFITGNNANDVKNKINTTINALSNWCEMNRLIINKEKTVAISFHQPQKVQVESPQVNIKDTVINYTEHIRFLGLWLDKNIHTLYTLNN